MAAPAGPESDEHSRNSCSYTASSMRLSCVCTILSRGMGCPADASCRFPFRDVHPPHRTRRYEPALIRSMSLPTSRPAPSRTLPVHAIHPVGLAILHATVALLQCLRVDVMRQGRQPLARMLRASSAILSISVPMYSHLRCGPCRLLEVFIASSPSLLRHCPASTVLCEDPTSPSCLAPSLVIACRPYSIAEGNAGISRVAAPYPCQACQGLRPREIPSLALSVSRMLPSGQAKAIGFPIRLYFGAQHLQLLLSARLLLCLRLGGPVAVPHQAEYRWLARPCRTGFAPLYVKATYARPHCLAQS